MLGRIVRSFWHGLASSRPPLGVSTSAAGSPASGVFVKHIASTEVVDDQKLLELAAEPERPLFPWLRDETSLAPLILLLAALARSDRPQSSAAAVLLAVVAHGRLTTRRRLTTPPPWTTASGKHKRSWKLAGGRSTSWS